MIGITPANAAIPGVEGVVFYVSFNTLNPFVSTEQISVNTLYTFEIHFQIQGPSYRCYFGILGIFVLKNGVVP